jgi:hypothetical protein
MTWGEVARSFFTDHRQCELDAGVDGEMVWIVCDWRATVARRVVRPTRADL